MCCNHDHYGKDSKHGAMGRRGFLRLGGLGAAGMAALLSRASGASAAGGAGAGADVRLMERGDKGAAMRIGRPLRVKPAIIYRLRERVEGTSWRRWGGLQSPEDVREEAARIKRELDELASRADFPVEFLQPALVDTPEKGAAARAEPCDVQLAYWASGEYDCARYDAFADPSKPGIMFVRDRSGPHYGGYLHAQSHWLRKKTDRFMQEGMDVRDVVVDDYSKLEWRLRALYGLNTMLGSRILAVGGASGWGVGSHERNPRLAREQFGLDIVEVSYDELGRILGPMMKNPALASEARDEARGLLSRPGVSMETEEKFLVNSLILRRAFERLMREHGCPAMTINLCMGKVMEVAGTTACLPLSQINDSGLLAFCESDFAVIPSCMLLRYISGRPVFLNDPCIPYDGMTTMAHCTSPRRLDGRRDEPVRLRTHYESDFGAAPQVAMREGQVVTVIAPSFEADRWTGFRGRVLENTDHPICRTQVRVSVDGDWQMLRERMAGFHWSVCYGDWRRELGYALGKVGIVWEDVSGGGNEA